MRSKLLGWNGSKSQVCRGNECLKKRLALWPDGRRIGSDGNILATLLVDDRFWGGRHNVVNKEVLVAGIVWIERSRSSKRERLGTQPDWGGTCNVRME